MQSIGLDIDAAKVDDLNAGHSYIGSTSATRCRAAGRALDSARRSTTTYSPDADGHRRSASLRRSSKDEPDLATSSEATRRSRRHLRPAQLVVLESTTYPGTTEEVVRPILERTGLKAGVDFHLAYSPSVSILATRTTASPTRPRSSAATRRVHRARRGVLPALRRHGRRVLGHAGGRDGQAAGEHLPARQHRARQRDGPGVPRDGYRFLGGDPSRLDEAVRVPGASIRDLASAVTASRSIRRT